MFVGCSLGVRRVFVGVRRGSYGVPKVEVLLHSAGSLKQMWIGWWCSNGFFGFAFIGLHECNIALTALARVS